MKFSEHWLRTLADPPIGGDALADALTMAGIEVEGRVPVAPPFSGVVAAGVIPLSSVTDAPDVCSVDGQTPVDARRNFTRHHCPVRASRGHASRRLDHTQGSDARRRIAGDALLGQ
jgi:hypothetical protein